jgi:hypothetical protein
MNGENDLETLRRSEIRDSKLPLEEYLYSDVYLI